MTFNDWAEENEMLLNPAVTHPEDAAEAAWDHQQQRIDELERRVNYVEVFRACAGDPAFISGFFVGGPFSVIEEIAEEFEVYLEEEPDKFPVGESRWLVGYNAAQVDREGRTEIPAWWDFTRAA